MKHRLATAAATAFFWASFLLLVISVASIAAHAQEIDPNEGRIYLGLHGMAGVPTGEFAKNVPNSGFGLSGLVGYSIGSVPIMVGLEGGFMIYGSKERREPFSSTIPDVTVKVNTTNDIALGHLLLRLQPQQGIVRPYLDGFAGVSYLATRTSVNNEGNAEQEIASSTNQDDAVFSYGVGGGVMIRLHAKSKEEYLDTADHGPAAVLLDLRGRYISGGVADYLTEGSIVRNGTTVQYTTKRSRTDLFAIQIGVAIEF
jgi:hypothetical protein